MPRKGVKMSDAAIAKQNEAIKAWHKEHTVQLCFRFRKEKAAAYKELAEKRGQSLSSLIQELLDNLLEN